jgi:hypothetical protein
LTPGWSDTTLVRITHRGVFVMAPQDNLPGRPDFRLPFESGATIELQTYVGHNPDDKKIDMYRQGMKTGSPILASAGGLVHEWFDPGGLEISHGNGWFTVYLHMSKRVASGTQVQQGDWIGTMGSVGTHSPHLHYEQLFNPNSELDADTDNMVHPLLQGKGPIVMVPGEPITMVSTNGANMTSTTRADAPHSKYFWVDIFEDAPVFRTPRKTNQTGTLKRGTSYVYAKKKGREVRHGPNFNHFWLKTDPDVGHGQWVSAFYLARWGNDEAKDNDGVEIPDA